MSTDSDCCVEQNRHICPLVAAGEECDKQHNPDGTTTCAWWRADSRRRKEDELQSESLKNGVTNATATD